MTRSGILDRVGGQRAGAAGHGGRSPGRPVLHLGLLLPLCLLLSAYVIPSPKLLSRWLELRPSHPESGPHLVAVEWNGEPGLLFLGEPGRHALRVAEGVPWFDPGPGAGGRLQPLWRALDLWAATRPEDLADTLGAAGFDLARIGFARDDCSADGVVHVLGARGEAEADLAQVWFARQPLWPCRVQGLGGGAVWVGPKGPGGLPLWLETADLDRLAFVGPPQPTDRAPLWAARPAPLEPSALPPDWRDAFSPNPL